VEGCGRIIKGFAGIKRGYSMICKKCGNEVSIMDKTCASCGADLTLPNAVGYKHLDKLPNMNVDNTIQSIEKETNATMGEIDNALDIKVSDRTLSQQKTDNKLIGNIKTEDKIFTKQEDNELLGAKNLKIEFPYGIGIDGKINYSLVNNDIPLIPLLVIKNISSHDIENIQLSISITPDFSAKWEKTIPFIHSQSDHIEKDITVPLIKKRILDTKESEIGALSFELFVQGKKIISQTYSVRILAFNEWFFHPYYPELLASFVLPNNGEIAKVIMSATTHLKTLSGEDSFDGYQSGKIEKIEAMVQSIYLSLQQELKVKYINPPPSFEPTGQKILFPDVILQQRLGTCLDLAVLFAACLERIGLFPLIFFIPGHAYLGYWRKHEAWESFWEKDQTASNELSGSIGETNEFDKAIKEKLKKRYTRIKETISKGIIVPLNSTTFTTQGTYEDCINEGVELSQENDFDGIVDVGFAREKGIKPLSM